MKISLPSAKTVLVTIVVIVCTITLTSLVAMLLSRYNNVYVPSFGTIYTVGYEVHGGDIVIKDGNPTLDWGTTYIGDSKNRSFYLRSKSNIQTMPLLKITDWNFTNSQGVTAPFPTVNNITIGWNLNHTTIGPGQEVYATVTLETQDDPIFVKYLINYTVTQFSFNMTIYPDRSITNNYALEDDRSIGRTGNRVQLGTTKNQITHILGNTSPANIAGCFNNLCSIRQNHTILAIFRTYHQTKDLMFVRSILGHKDLRTTLRCVQLLGDLGSDEWIVKATSDVKEACQLVEHGFVHVCSMDRVQRARLPFGT